MPIAKEHHFGTAKRIVLVIFVGNTLKAMVQVVARSTKPRFERFGAIRVEIDDSGVVPWGSMPDLSVETADRP